MKRANELSKESINSGGGPFGSVIVKNDKIISEGINRVTVNNDPTAHGEIVAIRNACKELNTFNLSGCELFSSCEPCPMCLSAIYWSHIDLVYYANNREDAKKTGNYDLADKIRKELNEEGIDIKDIKDKTTWNYK